MVRRSAAANNNMELKERGFNFLSRNGIEAVDRFEDVPRGTCSAKPSNQGNTLTIYAPRKGTMTNLPATLKNLSVGILAAWQAEQLNKPQQRANGTCVAITTKNGNLVVTAPATVGLGTEDFELIEAKAAAWLDDPSANVSVSAPASTVRPGAIIWKCVNCGHNNIGGDFCQDCGSPKAAPAQATPVQAAPVQAAPAPQAAPAQATPVQAAPVQAAPAPQAAPAQATPAQAAPVQAAPAPQATPAQATPAQATPAQATPAQATPAQATPAQATPAQTPVPTPVPAPTPAPFDATAIARAILAGQVSPADGVASASVSLRPLEKYVGCTEAEDDPDGDDDEEDDPYFPADDSGSESDPDSDNDDEGDGPYVPDDDDGAATT